MEQITLRNVAEKNIYDTYMGILRISPSMLDGQLVDDMSLQLLNPKETDDSERKIILSDSDGIKMGLYFVPNVRETEVVNMTTKKKEVQKVINLTSVTDANIYVHNSYNVRSTLTLNETSQTTRIAPIQVFYESPYNVGVCDVLNYPVDSPNDGSYFNSRNKLGLINYESDSPPPHEQLEKKLFEQRRSWYDEHIGGEHRVKVGDTWIYTSNKYYEQVPILYTKDYILGQFKYHTARMTDSIKTKFVGTQETPDKLVNNTSIMTRLSFIPLDKMVWDIVHEVLKGAVRHTAGRYNMLGTGQNESISERLFGTLNAPTTKSPLLGMSFPSGLIINHAMPFKRYAFYLLRQMAFNSNEEGNNHTSLQRVSWELTKNLDEDRQVSYKQYIDDGKVTPFSKMEPGLANVLTKEFVLCDGKELTYQNYLNVNTDNRNLFQHDDKGLVKRDANKQPVPATEMSDSYKAMIGSSFTTGKLVVPSLLAFEQQSPRYLRGSNWLTSLGVDNPIDFDETTIPEGTYRNNDKEFEVIPDSDYGATQKDFTTPGAYRFNADWKASKTAHRHYCFVETSDFNQDNDAGHQFSTILDPSRPVYRNGGYEIVEVEGEEEELPGQFDEEGNPLTEPKIDIEVHRKSGLQALDSAIAYRPYFWDTQLFSQTPEQIAKTLESKPAPEPNYFPEDNTSFGVQFKCLNEGIRQGYLTQGSNELVQTLDDRTNLVRYSFTKNKMGYEGRAPNAWELHTPLPCAAMFAWRVQSDGNMVEFDEEGVAAGDYTIQNHDQTVIAADKEARKAQLELMNKAEGRAPIASRGGTDLAKGLKTFGSCKAHSHGGWGKRHTSTVSFQPWVGRYELQRATSNTMDVPRLVTSLPIQNIATEGEAPKDPFTAEMGDQTVVVDDTLSFPPSTIMLPLFKI